MPHPHISIDTSGIAYFCPNQLHDRTWEQIHAIRQHTLDEAYEANPERFNKAPMAPKPPTEVWINPPPEEADTEPIEPSQSVTSDEEVIAIL